MEFAFNKQLLQPAHFLFSSYETHKVRPKFENFLLNINATNMLHMSMSVINFNFFLLLQITVLFVITNHCAICYGGASFNVVCQAIMYPPVIP